MAVKAFDEIYSTLSAQEKAVLDKLFEKEPELKGGWLRQDDYSRQQNKLKEKQDEYERALEYQEKMEPWAQAVYPRLHAIEEAGLIDEQGNVLWTEKEKEYQRQIEEAKALGGDVDPEKLEEIIKSKVQEISKNAGGLTKEEAAALYASESKKLIDEGFRERESKFNSETVPFVAGFSAGVAVLASRYEQESGEKWSSEKQKELYKLMSAEQNFDALSLEDKFLAPIHEKKKIEKEIEERAEKIAREKYGYQSMPGGGEERMIPQRFGGDARGLLQKALEESAKEPIDVRDAVRIGVVEGAKELMEQGA
jgi:hypothetical protein